MCGGKLEEKNKINKRVYSLLIDIKLARKRYKNAEIGLNLRRINILLEFKIKLLKNFNKSIKEKK
jgi:hypothetical protein